MQKTKVIKLLVLLSFLQLGDSIYGQVIGYDLPIIVPFTESRKSGRSNGDCCLVRIAVNVGGPNCQVLSNKPFNGSKPGKEFRVDLYDYNNKIIPLDGWGLESDSTKQLHTIVIDKLVKKYKTIKVQISSGKQMEEYLIGDIRPAGEKRLFNAVRMEK